MHDTRIIQLGDASYGGPVTRLRDGAIGVAGRRPVAAAYRQLVDALPPREAGPVLVARDPAGVLAIAARWLWPEAPVMVHHLDAWEARVASRNMARNGVDDVPVALTADIPPGPFRLVATPFPARAESLYGRELIERAHDALVDKGRLIASTDGSPSWLRRVVKEVFGRADLQSSSRSGAVVTARRTRSEQRTRDHDHVIRISRGDRELEILTRSGVFSPGRLDSGTKALLAAFVAAPGESVLDLGCGAGALGLAAAVDAGPAGVVMVDSNARAVAVATANAERNGLGSATVLLRADLEDLPGGFHRALANPPYFSHGRIAASFARAAASALRPDGVLQMVAKATDLHRDVLNSFFDEISVETVGDYSVLHARRARTDSLPGHGHSPRG